MLLSYRHGSHLEARQVFSLTRESWATHLADLGTVVFITTEVAIIIVKSWFLCYKGWLLGHYSCIKSSHDIIKTASCILWRPSCWLISLLNWREIEKIRICLCLGLSYSILIHNLTSGSSISIEIKKIPCHLILLQLNLCLALDWWEIETCTRLLLSRLWWHLLGASCFPINTGHKWILAVGVCQFLVHRLLLAREVEVNCSAGWIVLRVLKLLLLLSNIGLAICEWVGHVHLCSILLV